LDEGIRGGFDLTPAELKAKAAERAIKRVKKKADQYYKQMEHKNEEYIADSTRRVQQSRANNPGRDAAHQMPRVEEALEAKTFRCERCNLSFGRRRDCRTMKRRLSTNARRRGQQPVQVWSLLSWVQ
jgi:hypothetical protein